MLEKKKKFLEEEASRRFNIVCLFLFIEESYIGKKKDIPGKRSVQVVSAYNT